MKFYFIVTYCSLLASRIDEEYFGADSVVTLHCRFTQKVEPKDLCQFAGVLKVTFT